MPRPLHDARTSALLEAPACPHSGRLRARWWQWLLAAPILVPVRAYQLLISPLLGPNCRFQPTCSAYMLEAVRRHGPLKGGWMGLVRLLRCHPWGGYGFDPVPDREEERP